MKQHQHQATNKVASQTAERSSPLKVPCCEIERQEVQQRQRMTAMKDLQRSVERVRKGNEMLENENVILRVHYKRLKASADQAAMKAKEGMDGAGQEGALKKLGMSFKKKALSSERKSLTLKQKLKIANAEFEALQSMNQKEKSRLEEEIIAVRCELQLNDLQLKDLKKEAFEFKRDVVLASQGKEPSSQQETFPDEAVAVDKLLRFMETKEKQVKKKITKLSTKNDTLKAAINRLNHTLKSKETHHDGLHYIDFFQLQIENKQYAGKIEGKNAEVLQMKHKAAMLTLKFNRMKDELAEACLFSEQLKTKQKSIRGLMKKTELVVKQVTAEVEQEKLMMDGLQNHVLNNQAPTIAQYMEEKRMLKELETKINNLERKIDIVSIRQGSGSGSPDVKAVR